MCNGAVVYINMAIIGSPNFIIGIYNASEASKDVRQSCVVIQNMFESHYSLLELETDVITFDGVSGLSDSGPFLVNGVPAGGLTVMTDLLSLPFFFSSYRHILLFLLPFSFKFRLAPKI